MEAHHDEYDEHDHPSRLVLPLDDALMTRSQHLIAQALKERGLQLRLETPESARSLRHICSKELKNLEDFIFETFIEDEADYLRLISLRDAKTGATVGFVFWRNFEAEEMRQWMKHSKPIGSVEDLTRHLQSLSLKPEKLIVVPSPSFGRRAPPSTSSSLASDHSAFSSSDVADVDGWIKIELICIDPNSQHHHIGSLLLAAALAFAVVQEHKSHAVLQVAGGDKNKAALALYRKFHFERADHEFNIPNANLYVLRNIREALQAMNWEGFLLQSATRATPANTHQ